MYKIIKKNGHIMHNVSANDFHLIKCEGDKIVRDVDAEEVKLIFRGMK